MRRRYLFFALLVVCKFAKANDFQFIGAMRSEFNPEGLVEIGYDSSEEWIGINASVMYLLGNEYLFRGVNLSANIGYGDIVRPYIGCGVFFAEYQNRSDFCDIYSDNKKCQDSDISGIYPEVGLRIKVSNFIYGGYARYYKSYNDISFEEPMFGIAIGHQF